MSHPTNHESLSADVTIPIADCRLCGELYVPAEATGVVVFAHGSGTSRHNPQNRFVARELQNVGMATLLMDLLEENESHDRHNVFDIDLQASRLIETVHWLGKNPATQSLNVGYFGAGVGAGVALLAAAKDPGRVSAVVSRGGRPDLATFSLRNVKAPTLLIVGECDASVLDWNEDAMRQILTEKALVVVPGATHLFEEPGTLEAVAQHACHWFMRYLSSSAVPSDAAALTV
jgi:putative phosphoribosyl transferase